MCRHYCVFLNRKKVTLKDLQSLIGLLNFACFVIVPGRAFLRRFIDLTQGMQKPRHFIRLRQAIKEDLKIWQTFLFSFNGISFFLDETWCNSNKLNLFTDASGSIGFGAIFGTPNGVMANGRCHRRFAPPPQEIRPPGESESGPGFEVCLHNQSREPINFYHILTWAQICLLHVLYLRA
jgi:hypothetical protein